MSPAPQDAGRLAFEAYKEHMSGLTHDGRPIPEWQDVGDAVRGGWDAAAQAVVSVTLDTQTPTLDGTKQAPATVGRPSSKRYPSIPS